jgi:hypothetical protein
MNEYTNNIHARIDNILADAYFGAGSSSVKQSPQRVAEPLFDLSGLIWFILGVIVGVCICYYVWSNHQSQDDDDAKKD